MAQQVLQTVITLSGRVDNTFGVIGTALTNLGSQVNAVSEKLTALGKESIAVYRNYEDGMLETRSVLARQYGSEGELNKAMKSLEGYAQQWASTTIFHTDDVADAMAEAAHAGWGYEKIISGLPAAMLIAQAGSMDLSESVDYVAKMLASTNTSFEESERFIDQWARTADLVATNIPELGTAFLKLGSSAQFAESNEELFTMLAVLANVGTVGETAGTGVRNMMMRLIAPTKKAAEAMEGLGLSDEELSEAFDGLDETSEAAYKRLQQFGFTPYDEAGNLRGFIDIFTDLQAALDQIPSEQEQNELLAAIFPTRTLSYAKAMLGAVKDGSIYSIYKAIWGDSDGYAQQKSDIVMSGLSGSLEILGSKIEELKRKTGESLSPEVESFAESAGKLLDHINGMDEGKFGALVDGLSTIAITGPGLTAAGAAFRLIGSMFSPTGALALGAVGLSAFVAAANELSELDMESKFGSMNLDTDALNNYIKGIGESFNSAYEKTDKYNTALEKSIEDYQEASSTFSSSLMTKMLTGAALKDDDITALNELGKKMNQSVLDGVANSAAAGMTYWEALFGGEGVAENNPEYQSIFDVMNAGYLEAQGKLAEIGEKLRGALLNAAGKPLTPEEAAELKGYIEEYNAIMAEAAANAAEDERYANVQMMLRKAQTASLDEVYEIGQTIQNEREQTLAKEDDLFWSNYFTEVSAFRRVVEKGEKTQAEMDAWMAAAQEKHGEKMTAIDMSFNEPANALWDTVIRESGLSDAYNELGAIADRVFSGELTMDSAIENFRNAGYGKNWYAGEKGADKQTDRSQLAQFLAHEIASYGGYEGLMASADTYEAMGDHETAYRMRKLYAMDQINNAYEKTGLTDLDDGLFAPVYDIYNPDSVSTTAGGPASRLHGKNTQAGREEFEAYMSQYLEAYSLEKARGIVSEYGGLQRWLWDVNSGKDADTLKKEYDAFAPQEQTEWGQMEEWVSQNYDLSAISQMLTGKPFGHDRLAAAWVINGDGSENAEQYRIKAEVEPIVEPGSVEEAAGEQTIPAAVEIEDGAAEETGSLEMQAEIVGAAEAAAQAESEIAPQFGQTLTQDVNVTDNGSAGATRQNIQSLFGQPIIQRIIVSKAGSKGAKGKTADLYAEGGRADEASIFGEAGPEWAIPEAHTRRTAELLDAARAASGFSWPELLGMSGGLNADAGHTPTQLVYSPTIIANDASGVEQKLIEDKERLDRWWRERQLREDIAVYQ